MIGNTGTALTAFQRLLLPHDDTVTVRCPSCGHTEARAVEQAGIRCPVCGACVSVIPDRGRHLSSDRVEVSRYWGHGWLDRRGARDRGMDERKTGGQRVWQGMRVYACDEHCPGPRGVAPDAMIRMLTPMTPAPQAIRDGGEEA